MPEEISAIVPIVIGVAMVLAIIVVIGLGVGWMFTHPTVVLVFCGFIGFLVWRGAQRNRV